MREAVLEKLAADPELFLAEYAKRFGNVLNADDAATLFDEYNVDRAKYRVAVHPAATWVRDEMFRRVLKTKGLPGRNRIVFTAGGNAAGKTTAIAFADALETAQAVLDSTFSNVNHARQLVDRALGAGKRIMILHVRRPLDDALRAMLERAETEGRVVTIEQLVNSARGAQETVCSLREEFGWHARFQFRTVENSSAGTREARLESVAAQDYTEEKALLYAILDTEYRSGRISEAVYRRVRGRREPGQPFGGGQRG